MEPLTFPTPYLKIQPPGDSSTINILWYVLIAPLQLYQRMVNFPREEGQVRSEALKKHEANQRHKKYIATEKAINPKSTEMYKCCKKLYKTDDKIVKKK